MDVQGYGACAVAASCDKHGYVHSFGRGLKVTCGWRAWWVGWCSFLGVDLHLGSWHWDERCSQQHAFWFSISSGVVGVDGGGTWLLQSLSENSHVDGVQLEVAEQCSEGLAIRGVA